MKHTNVWFFPFLKQLDVVFPYYIQAQKPWAKKYEKVMKARDEFHKACKSLRTAEINERNQQADTSISEDQVPSVPCCLMCWGGLLRPPYVQLADNKGSCNNIIVSDVLLIEAN